MYYISLNWTELESLVKSDNPQKILIYVLLFFKLNSISPGLVVFHEMLDLNLCMNLATFANSSGLSLLALQLRQG